MSEFSESYHLRGSSRRDATELLARAGLAGFVFPALDGWVSFVAEGEPFTLNEAIVSANEGVLLRWVYGEDHGWEFNVFTDRKVACEYSCSWEEDLAVNGKVSHAQLERSLGLKLPALAGQAGLQIFYPSSMEEVFAVKPAYAFAAGVGLTNYRWLSYHYLELDQSRGHPLPPGVQAKHR